MKRLVDIRELNEQARVIDDLKCVSRPQLAPSPRSRVVGRQRSRARGPGAGTRAGMVTRAPQARAAGRTVCHGCACARVRVHTLVYVVVFC